MTSVGLVVMREVVILWTSLDEGCNGGGGTLTADVPVKTNTNESQFRGSAVRADSTIKRVNQRTLQTVQVALRVTGLPHTVVREHGIGLDSSYRLLIWERRDSIQTGKAGVTVFLK